MCWVCALLPVVVVFTRTDIPKPASILPADTSTLRQKQYTGTLTATGHMYHNKFQGNTSRFAPPTFSGGSNLACRHPRN